MANEGEKPEAEPSKSSELKTSDVYRVDVNLPARFNYPECYRGYSQKRVNPLYRTTNQTYGSKKPTVHEMPTTFSGSRRKFSEDLLKSGMYRDSGLNTMTDKTQLTGPNTASRYYDRINFHSFYQSAETSQ